MDLPRQASGPALLFFGEPPVAPGSKTADELLVAVPGSRRWRSVHPRRFRYLTVVGLDLREPPRLLPLPPALAAPLGAPVAPASGVFGIAPPRRMPRYEEAVWRRLGG